MYEGTQVAVTCLLLSLTMNKPSEEASARKHFLAGLSEINNEMQWFKLFYLPSPTLGCVKDNPLKLPPQP